MVVYILPKKIDQSAQILCQWLETMDIKTKIFSSTFELFISIFYQHEDIIFYNRRMLQFDHENFSNSALTLSLREEERALKEFYNYKILHKKSVIFFNFIENFSNNKLIQLEFAKKNGLVVPFTKIINNKKDLFKITKQIITKPIIKSITEKKGNSVFINYTSEITKSYFKNCRNDFFPSLVQEKIEKLFEIRSFYINGRFYSMAIFSQANSKTKVDFRSYDKFKQNRCVPFKLPFDIELKLKCLMKDLKLESGSIDIIKNIDNKYVFLEVNPNGEFGLLSETCNYNLEQVIAKRIKQKMKK